MTAQIAALSPEERKIVDEDLKTARKWLDEVVKRLAHPDADAKQKIFNDFHIRENDPTRLVRLAERYSKLRKSLDRSFDYYKTTDRSLTSAFVGRGDKSGTIYFNQNYFDKPPSERAETLIHERAHTVFDIHHAGMKATGYLDMSLQAGDDHHLKYVQAIENAYAYGWLAAALQPDYAPVQQGAVIDVVPQH